MHVTPRALRRSISSYSRSASAWLRLLVGSSKTMMRAPPPTAAAICTICCWAMDSSPSRPAHVERRRRSRRASRSRAAPSGCDRGTRASRQRAEAEVLGDGQVVAEGELLMHHRRRRRRARRAACGSAPRARARRGGHRPGLRGRRGSSRACSCPRRSRRRARGRIPAAISKRDVVERLHAGKALGDVPSKRTARVAHGVRDPRPLHFRYCSGTSVKPQSLELPRPGAEVVLGHAHQLHRDDRGNVLLEVELVDDRAHADVAPEVHGLREQHRREPLVDVGQLGGQRVDGDDLHLLRDRGR